MLAPEIDDVLVPQGTSADRVYSVELLVGVRELVERFDAFIVDLWGVVHDGYQLFHGVRNTLETLSTLARDVVFVTNSSRRVGDLELMLDSFGIGRELYKNLISSGEVAFRALTATDSSFLSRLGHRCLLIGVQPGGDWVKTLRFDFVSTIDDAQFILGIGLLPPRATLSEFYPLLRRAYANKVTLICANPDTHVVINGIHHVAVGALAKVYSRMGGSVILFGKPAPEIYTVCFEALPGVSRERIVAIGDSLETDIAGAAQMGLFTVLVDSSELQSQNPDACSVHEGHGNRLVMQNRLSPNAIMKNFTW